MPVAADIRPGLIVSGDAVELRVLVINLVKNAQEAVLSAPEPAQASGGRPYGLFITLDAADEGTAVRLTVANTARFSRPKRSPRSDVRSQAPSPRASDSDS